MLGTAIPLSLVAVVATAPPVGPLPKPRTTEVKVGVGTLVSVALPATRPGFVWRLARKVDPAVAREVAEADVGRYVVVVYKATGAGRARIVYALTRGERAKAYAAIEYQVRVTS